MYWNHKVIRACTRVLVFILTVLLIDCSFVSLTSGSKADHTVLADGMDREGSAATLLPGVCSHPWSGLLSEQDFEQMKELGVEYVRFDFVWRNLEPERNASIDFSTYDQFVERAKAYGIEIVALLLEVPQWLWPPDAWPGGEKWSIPRLGPDFHDFITQFGEFVYAIVDHYKGDITYFEIWNEANFVLFWRDAEAMEKGDHEGNFLRGVAIEKYVIMLQEAYTQAKAANSDCKIVSSGLVQNDYVYVQGMYDYGAKGYFDYLGLHPYFWHGLTENYDPDYVDWDSWNFDQFPKIQLVRNVMVANGDVDKGIFVTELGIGGSEGPEGATTEEMQADRLTRVFEKIDHDPGYPYISAVMWYQFRDGLGNFGLLRSDYTPKATYYAFKEVIDRLNPTVPELTPIVTIVVIIAITIICLFAQTQSAKKCTRKVLESR